ncbi:sodium- and chloride-dependent neutral and basic amino acid transporter B(0+)-like, partial [Notothenia coriiceps]|uniref:Sodium- and chloride-dependent neutral and basic amino acid transporter B(0+)-like n=1 Tax=Notothenia coriiceps TaxID=8208 RepID=A0A6I9PEK4_9TELE
ISMIGFAVGLGNIWRFPYLTYKHGSGAFLIPYYLMLVLCGIPLFFLENAIGQFCSQGPVNSWRAVLILQGVGLSVVLVTRFMSIYYNLIIAYSLYYMFASFQFLLPWSSCLSLPDSNCSTTPQVYCNVVYFTATFPYVLILILLIRGRTLEGARDGIEFYIVSQSNLTKLTEAQVWKDEATQTFQLELRLLFLIATSITTSTSVFAGFAIFSILGHMAHIYGKLVAAVVKEGFGLAFIGYPDTLAKLPIYPLWSILVFFMFIIVVLDSQFTCLEVITTCLSDAFRENFKSKRTSLTIGTCVTVFLLGLPCVTR